MFHSSEKKNNNSFFFWKALAQVQSHYPTDGRLELPLVPELACGRSGETPQVSGLPVRCPGPHQIAHWEQRSWAAAETEPRGPGLRVPTCQPRALRVPLSDTCLRLGGHSLAHLGLRGIAVPFCRRSCRAFRWKSGVVCWFSSCLACFDMRKKLILWQVRVIQQGNRARPEAARAAGSNREKPDLGRGLRSC